MPNQSNSPGGQLVQRLADAIRQARRASLAGARELSKLHGLTPQGLATDPLENVLAAAQDIIVESNRVFIYGSDIVIEADHDDLRLVTAAKGASVEPVASPLLANLFVCEMLSDKEDKPPLQFLPPPTFAKALLTREPTRAALPEIQTYATRSVFDEDFVLRRPGWHEDLGLLIHGIDFEPVIVESADPALCAIDRLPPHLRTLLGDFCFRSDADVTNAVGVMLTGILMPSFVRLGKALVLLDGNQSGLGKTLLARAIGLVLDGIDPDLIHFTLNDEELAKRICATLRDCSQQSVVLIDNAKTPSGTPISSPVIEANSMARYISLRILGVSANFRRPNDLLWFITMNDMKASDDNVTRGVPIQFHFEGDPKIRNFGGRDPLEYAEEYRAEILGELAGMVDRWSQLGRPPGAQNHRCAYWAQIIGGVLGANGFPEFLANLDEAANKFSTGLDELAALAEWVVKGKGPFVVVDSLIDSIEAGHDDLQDPQYGMPAAEWIQWFHKAQIAPDKLQAPKSNKTKSTIVGTMLSKHLGRVVQIEVDGCSGTAKLCHRRGRSNSRYYWLAVQWDAAQPSSCQSEERPHANQALIRTLGNQPDDKCAPRPPCRSTSKSGAGNQNEPKVESARRRGTPGENSEDW